MGRVLSMVGAVAVILQFAATPARAASITYEYTGELFNFCGFGCPGNAPADPRDADYLTATLTFGDPLAPNLTFADDVLSLLTGWTMTDAFGSIDFSSANGDTLGDPFPFQLATDGGGNIVGWQMFATSAESLAFIANPPPVVCPASDCGVDVYATDFVAVNLFVSELIEWDSGVGSEDPEGLPGEWNVSQVPEPATLTLIGIGLAAGIATRRRPRSKS